MAHQKPALAYGTAGVNAFTPEVLDAIFTTLEKHNVKELDTARGYVSSEEILGKAGAASRFTISTKGPSWRPHAMGKQKMIDGMSTSLKELVTDKVDIYYLHAPDPETPIEETLSAISQLYSEGKFKRVRSKPDSQKLSTLANCCFVQFGLSNYKTADVQKIYDIQSAAGAVLPTVFQGNYNAVARHIESDLFPLLRKLKISFYAYSPIAGGFLVKTSATIRANEDTGRFGPKARTGKMYTTMYGKESLLGALDEWGNIANDAGISKAALAYRWITYHSALKKEYGDGIIIGASKVSQLEETLKVIEDGPLDSKIAERVDQIWKKVEQEAPLDNYNSYAAHI
ncbi:Oxidoreductase sirO [Hyphodiscus hymeniophilus]|uniref:Oxidoreductase sirO n=1 Tax=Hyphodiscus hymeniophilus TaxID=353542 RepID=A0A9P6SR09_9HELO|nr:Oxidoreductase sirO [Hyphodiscus hymeniophilus]